MTALRILLVEDSPTQALRLQDTLQRQGYEVDHVASAEEALEVLNRRLPHLLIVDHHLPGLQGADLCRQLRLHVATFSMPILILTADETPGRQREGLDSGADDFLPKSADSGVLLLRVRNLLRHASRDGEPDVLPHPQFRRPVALVVGTPDERFRLLDAHLREEGCIVDHRATAADALETLRHRAYDCAFVAETLPDMAGIDLCRAVQQSPPPGADDAPALILLRPGGPGGLDDPDPLDAVQGLLEAGVDDVFFLDRPLAPLRARLRAILRRRFLQEQNRRLLEDFRRRESLTLRLEAERNAAEARAALADQLQRANTRLADANRRLAEQALVTRTITDNVTSALLMTDAAGSVTFLNPPARALLGMSEADLRDGALVRRLGIPLPPGRTLPKPVREAAAMLERPEGGCVPVVYSVALLTGESGPSGMVLEIVDVTERRQAEERQALLMAELSHRVKNTLATVISIGAQTRRRHAELTSFWPTFEGRLRALSATHNLLADHHWEWVRLSEVVSHEVRPYAGPGGTDVRLSGPAVALRPKAALALALVFHELATNAAKYGAFLRGGYVEIGWGLRRGEGGDRLHITWKEHGGPPIQAPPQNGFGSVLIRQSVAYELGGRAMLDFQADGLLCRLELPLSEEIQPAPAETLPAAPASTA
ncbi:response regulator [Rhodospirillum centenum]|uniref:histidine kinase n=2 Tax=Rhodospirillum centenum TaxID=34018 RepID=B6ITX7_RHOCS|nr:response regulator [Rhodospirillum centenum]AAP22926.1 CstS3 [Rhodospirillum centenum]ACI99513.1 cstS3 [Rhodospirillum centenum SW]